jgi:hypothetical protein
MTNLASADARSTSASTIFLPLLERMLGFPYGIVKQGKIVVDRCQKAVKSSIAI